MIEVSGLYKNYGPIQAIQNIQFHVKKGEVVGFLGPNGAGKSTTMKIITGAMAPSGGHARPRGPRRKPGNCSSRHPRSTGGWPVVSHHGPPKRCSCRR